MFDRALTSIALSAVAAVLIQPSLVAQDLSVTVSPNPAPPGATITVTAQDATGLGWYTPFGCLISSIVAGSPTGPTVTSFPCTFLGIAIPPCGGAAVRTGTWNTAQPIGGMVPQPGLYYFEILKSIGPFGAISTEWHSVTLDGAVPSVPALSALNTPNWGSVFQMALNAPNNGNDAYVVALSATTNTGLAVTGSLYLSLDIDAIFNLTFPTPDPFVFGNFQASLDAAGNSPMITINIPPLFAGCIPLHAQAATVDSNGSIALSNDLHFTIH